MIQKREESHPDSQSGSIEPDNDRCCQYYENDIGSGEEAAYEASVGNKAFDDIMKNRLRELLVFGRGNGNKKGEVVLEMFSGVGRNSELYQRLFKSIEMVEMSHKMYKHIPKHVKVHKVKV